MTTSFRRVGCKPLTAPLVRGWLPRFSPDANKYAFGHVLVVGGSRGMLGAACLAAESALLAGAGLCTLAIPESLAQIAAAKLTETMLLPLPSDRRGCIAPGAVKTLKAYMLRKRVASVVLGPGISTLPPAVKFVRAFARACTASLCLDADGINAFAGKPGLLRKAASAFVLTPHAGELGRLLGVSSKSLESRREFWAAQGSSRTGAACLLKGRATIICGCVAAGQCECWKNSSGSAVLATAGSGDVLAGMTAAFLGWKIPAVRAAAAAAFVHGTAGDIAARRIGPRGVLAGDIARNIPAAFKKIGAFKTERGA